MDISIRTVRSHLDRIRDKTGRRRRADLTRRWPWPRTSYSRATRIRQHDYPGGQKGKASICLAGADLSGRAAGIPALTGRAA